MNQPARKLSPTPGRPVRIGRHRVVPAPPLQVVEPPTPAERRRRTTRIAALAITSVFAALFGLAAFHTVLIDRQFTLDDINEQVQVETERHQQLRLAVAEMEAPERIVDEARNRLGMVEPPTVVYLSPSANDDPALSNLEE